MNDTAAQHLTQRLRKESLPLVKRLGRCFLLFE
jgi:hypothetical protein